MGVACYGGVGQALSVKLKIVPFAIMSTSVPLLSFLPDAYDLLADDGWTNEQPNQVG